MLIFKSNRYCNAIACMCQVCKRNANMRKHQVCNRNDNICVIWNARVECVEFLN